MNFLNKQNNIYYILMPLLALTSFMTWVLKFDIVNNIIIYGSIMLILVILKQPTSILMLVVLFAIPATYSNEIYLLYQILYVFVVIHALIDHLRSNTKIKGNLFWPLIISTTLSFLTLFWTPSFLDGLAEFLVIIQGIFAYFIIVNDDNEKRITIDQIAWIASLLLLVVGLQYLILTYKYFPNMETKEPLSHFWANANLVAALLGLLWVPSLYKYTNYKKNKLILLYLPLELIVIYAIYMSKSRGLYFGYMVGILAIALILLKVKNKTIINTFIIMIISFAATMFAIIVLKDVIPSLFEEANKISTFRLEIYEIAIKSIDNPFKLLFGNGLGAARHHLSLEGIGSIYYHSWLFHILSTRGLVNLLLQIYIIYRVMKLYDTDYNDKIKYLLIGLIIYLGHSLVDIGYDYQQLGIIYYIIIALTEKENIKTIKLNNMLLEPKINFN